MLEKDRIYIELENLADQYGISAIGNVWWEFRMDFVQKQIKEKDAIIMPGKDDVRVFHYDEID